MVHAVILLGAFDGDHVPDIFDHAYGIVTAHAVAADIAEFVIGDVKTLLQNLISLRMEATDCVNFATMSGSCLTRCSTSRRAVFYRYPGAWRIHLPHFPIS